MRIEQKIKTFILLVMLLTLWFSLTGCGSLEQQRVVAEALTYNAVGPRQKAYIKNDASLSAEDKEGYTATITGWQARIEESKPRGLVYDKDQDKFIEKK